MLNILNLKSLALMSIIGVMMLGPQAFAEEEQLEEGEPCVYECGCPSEEKVLMEEEPMIEEESDLDEDEAAIEEEAPVEEEPVIDEEPALDEDELNPEEE